MAGRDRDEWTDRERHEEIEKKDSGRDRGRPDADENSSPSTGRRRRSAKRSNRLSDDAIRHPL
jgi:hypothetical protein